MLGGKRQILRLSGKANNFFLRKPIIIQLTVLFCNFIKSLHFIIKTDFMSENNLENQNEEAWKQQLLDNPEVQKFLSKYKKGTLDSFISGYVNLKKMGLLYGKSYGERLDREESEGIDNAIEHLKAIQHKKLFDLQCLWRAGMVEVAEIKNTFDFTIWTYKILDCPFLEPINKTEIDWYSQFLSTQREMPETDFGSQDYHDFKENYQDHNLGEELPEWYDFHNMKTGNAVLMTYADIRGEQEKLYHKLRNEAEKIDQPLAEPEIDEDRDKPWLPLYNNKFYLELAEILEDRQTLREMTAYHLGTETYHTWEYERTERDIQYLSGLKDELVPIESHRDYREALHLAVERHRIDKIITHLPAAHRKYLWMLDNGFSLTDEHDNSTFKSFQKLSEELNDRLEVGRRINGE